MQPSGLVCSVSVLVTLGSGFLAFFSNQPVVFLPSNLRFRKLSGNEEDTVMLHCHALTKPKLCMLLSSLQMWNFALLLAMTCFEAYQFPQPSVILNGKKHSRCPRIGRDKQPQDLKDKQKDKLYFKWWNSSTTFGSSFLQAIM